jgi:hypothetical protein
MFGLQKIAAAALITLAGAAGLLVAAAPVAALGQGDTVRGDVSVLADSPWDGPTP